ncbi:MAG: hypothetical protein IJ807_02655 [Eubacterium sp.]|nr:hypothetical protein [Eubacterium sp.]
MKKNILTVVIMAATVINLVLTAVLVFSVMPAMNKTSNLIDKVASVIDLEIEDKDESQDYAIGDLESFAIEYDAVQNLNLMPEEGDDTMHVFRIKGISVSFNTKAEDYATVSEQIKTDSTHVKDIVIRTISAHTKSDFDQVKVASECVKKIQALYDTKCVVEVIFIDPFLA